MNWLISVSHQKLASFSLESHYRAQFRFDPNGITMATGNAHNIFYALSFDGLVVARVEFGKIASGYQIRASVVTDASTSTFTNLAWTTGVTDAPHKAEIEQGAHRAPCWPFFTLQLGYNKGNRVFGSHFAPASRNHS